MFKLILFCSFLILVSSKLLRNSIHSEFIDPDDEDLQLEREISKVDLKLKDVLSEDLWVLEIDDFLLSSVTLFAGNMAEDKEFEDAFGPLIERYEGRRRRAPNAKIRKQQQTEDSTDDDDEIIVKGKIMRLLNKFALSAMYDPNSYLFETEESDESPSLTVMKPLDAAVLSGVLGGGLVKQWTSSGLLTKSLSILYFKGPYSSLSVNTGSKKWRYFISPPSPLPRWFYEKHDDVKRAGHAVYVKAPKSVEKEFYKSLLDLLHRFLSVPV